jgi:2-keto-4-pentenoate hydratase
MGYPVEGFHDRRRVRRASAAGTRATMSAIDPALASALTVQLGAWRAALAAGAERVGWKLGVGDRERIGHGPVIGHLTSATELRPGAAYRLGEAAALHADAEVALTLGSDVDPGGDRESALAAIAGYGAALELVDLAPTGGGAVSIVAANVFHRAFALGPVERPWPAEGVQGRLIVDGETRASAPASADYAELVRSVAAILGAMGLRLQRGDRLITGSVVQVAVARGDEVLADLGDLGRVQLSIAP